MQKNLSINDAYLPYLDCDSRTQIFYGGSGSGKSVFVAKRCVLDVIQGGRNYLICRAVGRSIRKSVMNEIRKAIAELEVAQYFNVNRTDGIITCVNGYQIFFSGLDDTEKIKSITPETGVVTDIWIEEATEVNRSDLKDLRKRLRGGDERIEKRITLTFNPIVQGHWIYDEFFAPVGWTEDQTVYTSDDLLILKTWYVHNHFLTQQDVTELLKETDEYYRDVYTFGNWGVLGNVIFHNWQIIDMTPLRKHFTEPHNGLDFGYADDPAAYIGTHYDKKHRAIYIYDELYETDLTNDVLAEEVLKFSGRDRVICDSQEPKSIRELRRHNVHAVGARKGRDSVLFGIQWLRQQTIYVDQRCVNAINELRQYKWKEVDGRVVHRSGLPVPAEKNNHLIDALRYAYEDEMLARRASSDVVDFYKQPRGKPVILPARSATEIDEIIRNYQ